jgi:thioredoxin 2
MSKLLVRCTSCGSLNKADFSDSAKKPKCGKCKGDLEKNMVPVDITSASFDEEVTAYEGAVLLDLWSPTCGYCMQLNPILERIAAEKGESLKIVKVNVATESALASRFNVQGVPMMILFERGQKIDELAGFLPEPQLKQWLTSKGV